MSSLHTGKLLTVMIPTYNMEELLPQCLNSLCTDSPALEVIIVNDGSKDGSLGIAKAFVSTYPELFRLVDKPNGNYGSTINAALPLASGRWVKILDADDCFSPIGLQQTLSALQAFADSPSIPDLVLTHYSVISAKGKTELAKYNLYGKEPYRYGTVYPLDKVLKDGFIRFFTMHGIMWRTDLLRENGYRQTEGISYTDLEWAFKPVLWAQSIAFINADLYQYNTAREGQTMDPRVLLKSKGQIESVTRGLVDFVKSSRDLSAEKKAWAGQYLLNRLRLICKTYLLDLPLENFSAAEFREVEAWCSSACEELGLGTIKLYPENKLVRADVMAHWKKSGKRPSEGFLRFNHALDKVMKGLYILLFRR